MWVELFIQGVIIGLLASIPMGAIGVLCIQRALSKSLRSGFVSGLGAACADTIFAAIALFSLSMAVAFIETHISLIKLLGGISMVIVGMTIVMKNPVVQIRQNRAGKGRLWSDFISIFFITLANPAMILIFVALMAAIGGKYDGEEYIYGTTTLAGVLFGAACWWLIVTSTIKVIIRNHFRPRHLLWINRISGTAIIILGVIAILSIYLKISLYELPY